MHYFVPTGLWDHMCLNFSIDILSLTRQKKQLRFFNSTIIPLGIKYF